MFANKERNFILQQGFNDPADASCPRHYKALLFQPWVVLALVVAGTVTRSPWIFGALSLLLYEGALFPHHNLFDALYNATFGSRPGAMKLTPAPPPRRFSQALAGTFALGVTLSLIHEWRTSFWVLDGFFLLAVTALISGGLCFGSMVFYALVGKIRFAIKTLPWA